MKKILVKGSGVAGLTSAYQLMQTGADVTVLAPNNAPIGAASWYAGGMLAPFCERESAEQCVEDFGLKAMSWWDQALPEYVTHKGTLVVAPSRDFKELERFCTRTKNYKKLNAEEIGVLEADLAGRFDRGLFFDKEAHIDPRKALLALKQKLQEKNVSFITLNNKDDKINENDFDYIIDATGIAYLDNDKDLRGVRGEMLLVKTDDITFSRPIRLLHPRIPLYIVPRDDHLFMIGATMIESAWTGKITARSMMELLNAAYTLHPAFAEAEIIEAGVALRPSYPDNFPRVKQIGNKISINGFYRHGFLLAPEMARKVTQCIMD
ncbi:glycine oxidase ThiO [Bartonella tamiae]|uniref:D-amino-acid oxidase n=1 Tax=Bartonella tamiae Th239 TaxID=1094558 RepID=J1JZP1_9HYPH|nr:glycine oxidase ThiO [Bartonella tamiae]EJF90602.1 glycine oxidase ThiO [Bartonella tamiae Th239]EJF94020.1 glycine oxidase ThiO [Bartonella tamiae Th307]